MKPEDVKQWALRHGYRLNTWGKLVKEYFPSPDQGGGEPRTLRLVITKVAVRTEAQVKHSDGSKSWVRVRSAYLRDLSLTPDDKLAGLTARGCQPAPKPL